MSAEFIVMSQIKNLIFDLGGVILDLTVTDTLNAFSAVSGLAPELVADRFRSSAGFEAYERGEMVDDEFRAFIRSLYNINIPDSEIDRCWNAMLGGVPEDKLSLLKTLKNRYKVFLLSNTNTIHVDYINTVVLPPAAGKGRLEDYFHRTYYSHLMGKRKPEARIFQQVVDENGLTPSESLFLDDNKANVEGARAVGLQAVLVNTHNFILDYFHG